MCDPHRQSPQPHRQGPQPHRQGPHPHGQTPQPHRQGPHPPGQSPQPHRLLWDRQRLLQDLERAHKADIKTYLSGHLRPDSLHQKRPYLQPKQPIWEMAEALDDEPDWAACLKEQQKRAMLVEDMKEAMTIFTSATTSLHGRGLRKASESDRRPETAATATTARAGQPRPVLDTAEVFLFKPWRDPEDTRPPPSPPPGAESGEVDQGRFWFTQTHLAGLTRKDQLRMMREFGRTVLKKQDLVERDCISGSKVAEAHHRKLEQELQKLPVQPGPSRVRLRVFSDVFADVCDRSPVFGGLLREIKAEYDSYLDATLRRFQPSLQDVSEMAALSGELESGLVGERELAEAEKEVLALAAEARKALEENNRVRQQYQLAQERCPDTAEENGSPAGEQEVEAWEQQEEVVVAVRSIQPKRRLVWSVWEEVQALEKDMKENMVSTTTTSATEKYIRDAKTEILHLLTANEHLKTSNKASKDMEDNIDTALDGVVANEKMKDLSDSPHIHTQHTRTDTHVLLHGARLPRFSVLTGRPLLPDNTVATMRLLRLLALLLLCTSSGMAASLGHSRQALEEAEEPPAVAEEPQVVGAPEAPQALVADSPAAEEHLVADSPVVEAPAEDSPAMASAPVEDAPVVVEDSHAVAADTPVETPVEDAPAGDSPAAAQAEDSNAPARAAEVANKDPAIGGPAGEAAMMDVPADTPAAVDTPAGDEAHGDTDTPVAADAPFDGEMAADAPVDGEMAADAPADDGPADLLENLIPEGEGEGEDSVAPTDDSWTMNSIRSSFQAVNTYFDSLVEMMGGRNGVCQYRCRYGKTPTPRPGYAMPEPNGCSSSLLGFEFDLGIPAMTKCCDQLDVCYDTCGANKNRCDSKFRWCLHGICSELKKSLGFVSKVEVCESMADAMYNTVWTLGCRPYMNSQRAACFCEGEERDEL
ncbi:hypothetical protein ACEWY4_020754 [Coilia grayii]|uniref:Translin-associated factor X-interacting protein 1 N-terminal domain-containing protein n=1 Tax=Coilia grayii TaxID=363190 RepID=A0ABD1J8E9_9TELE